MKYEAFLKFSDINLNDYIIKLNWKIKAKSFPYSKQTIGNSGDFLEQKHPNCFPDYKVFKNISEENILENGLFQQTLNTIVSDQETVILQSDFLSEKIIINENFFEEIKEVKNLQFSKFQNIAQDNKTFISEEFKSYSNNNSSINNNINLENHSLQIDEVSHTNINEENIQEFISNTINQKFEESTNISVNELIELEQNLNSFASHSNNVIIQNISNLENKIEHKNEMLKYDVEVQLKKHKDFIEKFINS